MVVRQKSNLIRTISIKSGSLYEGKKLKNSLKKLYYPGEVILSNINIKNLSFCEHIVGKNTEQLLVRPISLYEVPYSNANCNKLETISNKDSIINLKSKIIYPYKPTQVIRGTNNINLISTILTFTSSKFIDKNISVQISKNKKKNSLNLFINERLNLNNYISPQLRYKNILSCLLIQQNQFIDKYTILGYLEATTINSLEIVKFKIKNRDTKQILLISNEDCLTLKKEKFLNKKLNDFITNSSNVNETGKIIIENNHILTLQKGRPYFFPNCKNEDFLNKTKLQYKTIRQNRVYSRFKTNRQISLNYYDLLKLSIDNKSNLEQYFDNKVKIKAEFSKLFLKRNGKLYSSLIPQFFKKISFNNKIEHIKLKNLVRPKLQNKSISGKMDRTLIFQSSELLKNQYKEN